MSQAPAKTASRSNSIAFLRLLLATLVIFSHASDLGKFPPDFLAQLSGGRWNFGGLAVDGFFFLSGLLITQSYVRLRSFPRFAWHRFLRIFPGFWVCLAVTAFVFAPIVYWYQVGSLQGFFSTDHADGPVRYLYANALLQMNQYTIDGLLKYVPFPGAFNGSLWTLASEFKCYIVIGVLGAIGILGRGRFAVLVAFLAMWLLNISPDVFHRVLQTVPFFSAALPIRDYLDWTVYFFLGSVTFFYRDQVALDWKLFVVAVLTIPTLMSATYFEVLLPFALSYALFWLAYRLPIRSADRYGDFSYGVYIYAFPMMQLLAFFQLNRFGYWPFVVLTILFTIPLAVLSWHLIEGPAMRLKDIRFPAFFSAVKSSS
jgi:peptidoglycan/LPS O-acetylase OafA/YrhL